MKRKQRGWRSPSSEEIDGQTSPHQSHQKREKEGDALRESGEIRVIRKYFENLHLNIKWNKILGMCGLLQLEQRDVPPNSSIAKPWHWEPRPNAFAPELHQTFKESLKPTLLQLFHKTERKTSWVCWHLSVIPAAFRRLKQKGRYGFKVSLGLTASPRQAWAT